MRSQATRRRRKATGRFRMPRIALVRLLTPMAAVAAVFLCYRLSTLMLDQPIRSITIEGAFQRVSALQIEEAISDRLSDGFLTVDLSEIQRLIVALPWIDQANVSRRWPNRLEISVTEQVPAACWGESGLLNTRGELFVREARHIPAELPHLSGPENHSAEIARRYLAMRERLMSLGLDLRRVHMDPRGAWELTLQNGIDIRLGKRDVESRTELFLDIVTGIITSRASDIEYVDMRYSNGFTIGWKSGMQTPTEDPTDPGQKLVALRGAG